MARYTQKHLFDAFRTYERGQIQLGKPKVIPNNQEYFKTKLSNDVDFLYTMAGRRGVAPTESGVNTLLPRPLYTERVN